MIKFIVYVKNKVIGLSFLIGFLLNILLCGYLYFQIKPQEEPFLLHYNIFLGIDLIGSWWQIYYIPILGLIILLINFIIGWLIFIKAKILCYFLVITALISQIFLIISTIFIILINY